MGETQDAEDLALARAALRWSCECYATTPGEKPLGLPVDWARETVANTAVGTRLDDEADVEIELEIPTAALRRTLCARPQRHGVTVHLARGGGVVADVLEVDEPLRRALC